MEAFTSTLLTSILFNADRKILLIEPFKIKNQVQELLSTIFLL